VTSRNNHRSALWHVWILKNGSKGAAMASFVPLVLTEEEAWQVVAFCDSVLFS
jgi:hypothetical protein